MLDVMNERVDDFDNDDLNDGMEADFDVDSMEGQIGLGRPASRPTRPRAWRSVEEYMEQRRLRQSLSDYDDFDI